MSLPLLLVAPLVVGTALTFAGRFEHFCAATLQLSGASVSAQLPAYRKELLEYAWHQSADQRGGGPPSESWSVDSLSGDRLRLGLTTTDRKVGVERVRQVAQGYLATMDRRAAAARATPTDGEQVLSQYADALQTRLTEAQSQLEASLAGLPDDDPTKRRDALASRWQTVRSEFSRARERVAEATTQLARLEDEPEPTHGIVPADERHRALQADLALQQDLRELHVNFNELKLHLLNVWQDSGEPLERLTLAADDLLQSASRQEGPHLAPSEQGKVEELVDEAEQYRTSLLPFTEAWNREFTALKRQTVDPLTSDVIETHQRTRSLLNDFLYEAAKRLSAMRSQVRTLGEDSADGARLHVLQSNLLRGFHALQSAHHRFEFAAGAIEARDNFHLETALRSARGLRRRSQHRIQGIDTQLQEQAARQAREQHARALAETKDRLGTIRAALDETVVELVALQGELNVNAGLTEGFLREMLQAEAAESRMRTARADLTRTETGLNGLAAKRTSAFDGINVELVECGTVGGPVNFAERLRMGGLAALLTLLSVGLVQWWLSRR